MSRMQKSDSMKSNSLHHEMCIQFRLYEVAIKVVKKFKEGELSTTEDSGEFKNQQIDFVDKLKALSEVTLCCAGNKRCEMGYIVCKDCLACMSEIR